MIVFIAYILPFSTLSHFYTSPKLPLPISSLVMNYLSLKRVGNLLAERLLYEMFMLLVYIILNNYYQIRFLLLRDMIEYELLS